MIPLIMYEAVTDGLNFFVLKYNLHTLKKIKESDLPYMMVLKTP